jgi:selenocysteine lyase/cysteine desulfurase
LIGSTDFDQTIGVVSCVFDSYSSDSIGKILSDNNIAVRIGLHCSPYAHRFLDTFPAGTVRFSIGYFTSENDFVHLENVLEMIEENS